MSKVDVDLGDLLAKVLPTEAKVTIRHVSSAPTPCGALFAAPPGEQPESTFCENHFLTVSVDTPSAKEHETETEAEKGRDNDPAEIIVFGMEVLVYSTTHLTTIFVSKADSTGYLHLLKLPPRASLLRQISSAFLSYLVQTRQRPGVRLVVSLFARAQNQYLFPGSIENPEKHVLDDRGLIKWWCRVVDPILRTYEPESKSQEKGAADQAAESAKSSATAFLIVPGCDRFETRGFFPASTKADDAERPRWVNSYPVRQLCDDPDAPPRCLIPRLPDDPKTRFLVDLDDELPAQAEEEEEKLTSTQTYGSGQWRSVKSLDQFWEMMSFRQECSAGRLVGFLWLVVNPPGLVNSVQMMSSRPVSGMAVKEASEATTTATVKISDEKEAPDSTADASGGPDKVEATTAAADTNAKEGNTSSVQTNPNETVSQAPTKPPTDSNAFFWPDTGRGHAVLTEDDYKTAINYLLNQDFYDQATAIASTRGWGEKVASLADQLWVGQPVVGSNAAASVHPTGTTTNLMDGGLVRKRKKTAGEGDKPAVSQDGSTPRTGDGPAPSEAGVNVLQANLVRKKKKT